MLNPNLNIEALAENYRIDKRVLVLNLLKPEIAERLYECCLKDIPYNLLFVEDGQTRTLTPAAMVEMDDEAKQLMNQRILTNASEGSGFLYCGYTVRQAEIGDSQSLAFLLEVAEFFASVEMRDFIAEVTGQVGLDGASGHYTRYTPGQFLTRHRDQVGEHDRRLGYVLNLTKSWHPDWGGLLQFYTEEGFPRDGWTPQFNALALFDTTHIHAVTYVAPFARSPRLSYAGWFLGETPIVKSWSTTIASQ